MSQTLSVQANEHQELIQLAGEFARKEIEPRIAEYDRAEETPVDLLREMGKLGLLGTVLPTEYGGGGLDFRTYVDIVLEIAKVDQNLALFMTFPSGLAGAGILEHGTEEQKQQWVVPQATGEIFGATGVTEPRSGSDVAGMETTYRRDGDDFVINGAKAWTSNVGIASFVLTFATHDRSLRHKGISAFIIPTGTPGMEWSPYKDKLGFRSIGTGDLFLNEVRVPASSLVGEEGQGFRVAMSAVERGRLGVATRALGLTLRCLEESKKYANEREVFDRRIAEFQIVQSKITDMVIGAWSSREMIYQCADAIQRSERARQLTCMAKMHASDVAQRSANDAIQIHGAYGTSSEYAVSRCYRDAKVLQIVEGSNDLHRALIAEMELGLRPNK